MSEKGLLLFSGMYLFLIPWDIFFVEETIMPFSPSFIFLGILLLVYFSTLVSDKTINFTKLLLPLFILLLYSTFSIAWTTEKLEGIYNNITLWSYFLTLIVFYDLIKKKSLPVKKLLWYYILGTLSVGIFALIIYGFPSRRLTITPESNPTMYAAFLLWAVVVSLNLFKNSTFALKTFLLLLNIMMILLLLLTQGRNAILAMLVALPITYIIYISPKLFTDSKRIKKNGIKLSVFTSLMGLMVFSVALIVLFQTGLNQRLDNIASLFQLTSEETNVSEATSGRSGIWRNYLDIFGSMSLFGGGISSSESYYGESFINTTPPHNVYILALVEYGVIGMVLWLLFISILIKYVIEKKYKNFSLIWLAFIFIFLGLGNDIFYYKYWWIGLILFLLIKELNQVPVVGKKELTNGKNSLKY